jgi:hypothetical protein
VLATTDTVLDGAASGRLVRDGSSLFWLSTVAPLDAAERTTLTRFDLGTGTATTVLDGVRRRFEAFAAVDGIVYLGGDRAVSALRVPGCFASPLIDDRHARLTAFVLAGGSAYWAESARGLAFSTLYSRPKSGGSPRKLADAAGAVSWISVDATDVYFLVTPAALDQAQVLRVARP